MALQNLFGDLSLEATQQNVFGELQTINSLTPNKYDAIDLTYNLLGQVSTVKYYLGGITGTLVSTLNLTYDVSGNLKTVSRT